MKDSEIFFNLIIEIFISLPFLAVICIGVWMASLWVQVSKDQSVSSSLISKVFPTFIFSGKQLSERNKLVRKKFFFLLKIFLMLMVLCVIIAILNPNGLNSKTDQRVQSVEYQGVSD